MELGKKLCVLASSSYLAILLAAAWFAAAPVSVAVSPMCDSYKLIPIMCNTLIYYLLATVT